MKPQGIFRLFSILIIILILASCNLDFNIKKGNGNITTTSRKISDFSSLEIGGNYKLSLEEGNTPSLTIKTDENLLDYINVESYGDKLYINNVHTLKSTDGINIHIIYQHLNTISCTGTSSIKNAGSLKSDQLKIDMSGAGAVEMDLEVAELEVDLSGAGVVKLSGYAKNEQFDISGAGGLRAYKLKSNNCEISLSGIGGAEIYVTQKLDATISGIGGISYRGQPSVIERHVTGLGKIKQSNEYFEEEENL